MKLTIFGEHTEGVKEFYEKLVVEGYVGSVKAIRLDKTFIGSEPCYAIRLKGNLKDCFFSCLRRLGKDFLPRLRLVGRFKKIEGKS